MMYDGLDIRKEFKRICSLECWHPAIRDKHPHLDIVRVQKGNVRTLGMARWQKHHIRLRIQVGRHTRYDIMETLVHEVAHIDAQHRENDAAKAAGRTRVQISHGPTFWESMDMGWAAAYPTNVKFVGPYVNKFHGRYSKALREQATADNF
ncbi:MAG TPA: SprT-like domain-containing protein, partial [Nitrospira sp.]|nr:SprT-like domain-containing protein [Nitrospira sp.]